LWAIFAAELTVAEVTLVQLDDDFDGSARRTSNGRANSAGKKM
jgi:hypothetical protein